MGYYKELDIELDYLDSKTIDDSNDYEVLQNVFCHSVEHTFKTIDTSGDDYEME